MRAVNTPAPEGVPKSLRERVLDWSDERRSGHPIMVTTAKGWAFWPSDDHRKAEHTRGSQSIAAAVARLRAVKRCACARCTGVEP